jgi:hypothetical protein
MAKEERRRCVNIPTSLVKCGGEPGNWREEFTTKKSRSRNKNRRQKPGVRRKENRICECGLRLKFWLLASAS